MSSTRSQSTRSLVLVVLPLAAVWLATLTGCPFSPKNNPIPPPPPLSDYLEQSSAAYVLANLRTAYEKKNFDEYDKLFSPDYVFVFNPADVGDPENPTPQQWFRADEMDSARNLFSNDRVEYITLNWNPGEAEPSDEVIQGSWKVRVDAVNLDVHTRNENNEVWIYEVKGAVHVFYFREDPSVTFPASGKHKWYCIRWDDSPIGGFAGVEVDGAKVQETSWGAIKSLYR
jgi:hypothetical protein